MWQDMAQHKKDVLVKQTNAKEKINEHFYNFSKI